MLKKALIGQSVFLLLNMTLGLIMVQGSDFNLKPYHTLLGLAAGGLTIISTYLMYKEKLPIRILAIGATAILLTLLAGIGGKVGESNYATGLLMMRGFGVSALIFSIAAMYFIHRRKSKI